ncbi:MAG: squalene/phytoene synthase family protein [Polyangiales bacterium]
MNHLERLLGETSRTFALAIPLLDEALRAQVVVAYLLFRIADTFEDAERWPRARRRRALMDFAAMVLRPGELSPEDHARIEAWVRDRPCDNASYLELVGETARVLEALAAMPPAVRSVVALHAVRTCDGMARVVSEGEEGGRVELTSLRELQAYCYIVAGIVGELLTDLFALHTPSVNAARAALDRDAATFGEALQLVNILKDQRDDARDGRRYLPREVPTAQVFALAREDLGVARRYIGALQGAGAPRGMLSFCALPVILAVEALDAVERDGPGSKVPRATVFALAAALEARLDQGLPALA